MAVLEGRRHAAPTTWLPANRRVGSPLPTARCGRMRAAWPRQGEGGQGRGGVTLALQPASPFITGLNGAPWPFSLCLFQGAVVGRCGSFQTLISAEWWLCPHFVSAWSRRQLVGGNNDGEESGRGFAADAAPRRRAVTPLPGPLGQQEPGRGPGRALWHLPVGSVPSNSTETQQAAREGWERGLWTRLLKADIQTTP